MRIYGARQRTSLQNISNYIGKDVWVRAILQLNNRYARGFIRVIDSKEEEHTGSRPDGSTWSYTTTVCMCNIINMSQLSRDGAMHCTSDRMNTILNRVYTVSMSSIQILSPIECRETDEIFVITDPKVDTPQDTDEE